MKHQKTITPALGALALAIAAFAGPSLAAPVVYIDPVSQDVAVGATAGVNIVVAGLNQPAEAVGGFSLTLGFNSSLLAGLTFNIVPGGQFGANPLDLSDGFMGGTLDLFFVADEDADQGELAALQGGSFVLASITFEGLQAGLSPLTLSNVVLSNWDGSEDFGDIGTRNGQICVGGNCTVPEPASYALALVALGAAGLARRRAKAVG